MFFPVPSSFLFHPHSSVLRHHGQLPEMWTVLRSPITPPLWMAPAIAASQGSWKMDSAMEISTWGLS